VSILTCATYHVILHYVLRSRRFSSQAPESTVKLSSLGGKMNKVGFSKQREIEEEKSEPSSKYRCRMENHFLNNKKINAATSEGIRLTNQGKSRRQRGGVVISRTTQDVEKIKHFDGERFSRVNIALCCFWLSATSRFLW